MPGRFIALLTLLALPFLMVTRFATADPAPSEADGVDTAPRWGCPLPAHIPDDVLHSVPFQQTWWNFSLHTYPRCRVDPQAYARSLALRASVPRAPQAQWGRGGRVHTRALLSNGMGETPWAPIGPVSLTDPYGGVDSGHVEAMAIDPKQPSILYIGAQSGGIWKTTDAGSHWLPLNDSVGFPAISALAVDPTNSNVVYAGSGDGRYSLWGYGFMRSVDGGAHWASVGTVQDPQNNFSGVPWFWHINHIVVSPVAPATLIAATSAGLFKSLDSGTTWTYSPLAGIGPNWAGGSGYSADDVVLDPRNPQIVYAGVGDVWGAKSNAGVYKSTDGGKTWALLTSGPNGLAGTSGHIANAGRIQLSMVKSPTRANLALSTLYASVSDTSNSYLLGFWRSLDGGTTWSRGATPDTQGGAYWYGDYLAADPYNPSGRTVWSLSTDLFESTNGGSSWVNVSNVYGTPWNPKVIHPDMHVIVFGPKVAGGTSSTVYVGNDGGVTTSTDGGATWHSRNSTLDITQAYDVAADSSYAPNVIAGTQDNGTIRWNGVPTSLQWGQIYGGDGGYVATDYTAPKTYFQEYINLDMHKSTNGGVNWSNATNGITDNSGKKPDNACFIAPFRMDPGNAGRLIAGTKEIWETIDGAGHWTAKSGDLTSNSGCINSLAIAPSHPQTIYATTTSGKGVGVSRVWRTDNDGGSWTDVSAGLSDAVSTSVAIDPRNPAIAYVTQGYCLYGGQCIYRTSDGGAHWTDITGNIPDNYANVVAVDPVDSSQLYIGTDTGVYETTDVGAHWARLDAHLPIVSVNALNLNHDGTILTAGTYGRGVYQMFRSWVTAKSSVGAPGSVVSLVGHGFTAGERITISFNGVLQKTVPADGRGTVSSSITVPPVSRGAYPLDLQGTTSGRSARLQFTVIQLTVPGPPTNLTATPVGTSIQVSWNRPASNGGSAIWKYIVALYGADGVTPVPGAIVGGPRCLITAHPQCTATVSGVKPGETYTVAVAARNAVGPGPAAKTIVTMPV